MLSLIESSTPSRSCRSLHRADCRIIVMGEIANFFLSDIANFA